MTPSARPSRPGRRAGLHRPRLRCLEREPPVTASRLRISSRWARAAPSRPAGSARCSRRTSSSGSSQLDLGDASLVFGRIDRAPTRAATRSTSGVSRWPTSTRSRSSSTGGHRWPSPSTGRPAAQPMGLRRRRHFATRGRKLLAIEDELFGDLGRRARDRTGTAPRRRDDVSGLRRRSSPPSRRPDPAASATSWPRSRASRTRSSAAAPGRPGGAGRPRHRQDRRGPPPRRLPPLHAPVPTRGPGRARRRPEPAVPRLHRAGAAVARRGRGRAGGAGRPDPRRAREGPRPPGGGAGQGRSPHGQAARARRSPTASEACGADLEVGYGLTTLRVREGADPADRPRGPPPVPQPQRGASSRRGGAVRGSGRRALGRDPTPRSCAASVRSNLEVREALERMWPVLKPAQLLHDLFGSAALLRSAGRDLFDADELAALDAPSGSTARPTRSRGRTTTSRCSTRPAPSSAPCPGAPARGEGDEEPRTYGHIVVDEAQDLSPMQLRVLVASLPQRIDDDRRRHRAGHRGVGP